MLGDVAVAVHPDNERLKHLIGKHAMLHSWADASRSSPTITPIGKDARRGQEYAGHDFNDFEVGKRHGLPLINVFDEEAHLTLKR